MTATVEEREAALARIADEIVACTRCELHKTRTKSVPGEGPADARIMLIGEAPGWNEDQQGRPFVGAAGKFLQELLASAGMTRDEVFITNVVKSRPPGNRDPLPDEIDACRPYLEAQLAYMQPRVIVTLGNFATRFILDEQIGITRARGRRYFRRGATVIPTFHPAAALRGSRFGGMNPVDAIRADLRQVQEVLQSASPRAEGAPSGPEEAAAEPDIEASQEVAQLGLF